jgi:hypothetical protein
MSESIIYHSDSCTIADHSILLHMYDGYNNIINISYFMYTSLASRLCVFNANNYMCITLYQNITKATHTTPFCMRSTYNTDIIVLKTVETPLQFFCKCSIREDSRFNNVT